MELSQAGIHGMFGFSRPDLDGNQLAKGICLARKARDIEVLSGVLRVVIFDFLKFKSVSKGLR